MSTAQVGQYSNVAIERLTDLTLANAAYGGPVPGTTYWVHNRGSSSYDGKSRNQPLPTLALALTQCTAGDQVVLLNGHAETIATTGVAWTQSGVHVVGLGLARNRPALTAPAAVVSAITISGNNNKFRNCRVIQSSSQTKAAGLIAVTGTDNIIGGSRPDLDGNEFLHGTAAGDAIILTAAARTVIQGNTFLAVGAAAQTVIQVKGNLREGLIADNIFNYGVSLLKSAVVFASATTSNLAGTNILRNIATGLKVAFVTCNASVVAAGGSEGLISGNRVAFGQAVGLFSGTASPCAPGGLAIMDTWFVDGKRVAAMTTGVMMTKASVVNNNLFRFSLPT